jgi:hypothetical protein
MPMGKGTYGSQRGRPPSSGSMLSKKQRSLPTTLKRKILKSKMAKEDEASRKPQSTRAEAPTRRRRRPLIASNRRIAQIRG